ncbi:hypothetical protein AVEN_49010-1 [Araneus ventricosus]|uniref:Uncharacterized protein n=1 Tax=Araneus ventricosus TaxID=182803 RepID=A0A4Y2AHH6_ARAVE|nr:hypothetical protein AVEN_49010-1 [Araneus ventricosus]
MSNINNNEMNNVNLKQCTNVYDGEHPTMDIDIVNTNVNNTECLNSKGVISDNLSNTLNGNGDSTDNINVTRNENNVLKPVNNSNCFVYTVTANDIHSRIVNNCVVYNVPNGEITASDADSHVMQVVPTDDSANPNGNKPVRGKDNDNFRAQEK